MKKISLMILLSFSILALTSEEEIFIRKERQESGYMEFWSEIRTIGTIFDVNEKTFIISLNENVYSKTFWISIRPYLGEKLSNYPNIVNSLESIDKVKFIRDGKSLVLEAYFEQRYYDPDNLDEFNLNTSILTKNQESYILDGGYNIQLISGNKIVYSTNEIEDNSVSDEIYREILKESLDEGND